MLRAILSPLIVVLGTVSAYAASCDGYDVRTFVADSPYLLNRMTVVEDRGASGLTIVHDDDPGISAVFALEPVDQRPIVRRSDFLKVIEAEQLAEAAKLQGEGRIEVERSIYPYDPMAWTISAVDAPRSMKEGTTTIVLSRDCDLVVSWQTSISPVLAGRVSEFRAALDVVRSFSGQHIPTPLFLKEYTAPQGYLALLIGFVAPVIGALALSYGLSTMRLQPRPGVVTRLIAVAGALVAGTSIVLHLAMVQGDLQFLVLSMLGLLGLSVLLSLGSAIFPFQVLALLGFCLLGVTGLAFGSASYLGWLPGVELGYATAACLVAIGVLGLWFWQYLEAVKVRRRTTQSI